MVWKSYHEKFLNKFAWDRDSFSQADTVSSVHCLIGNGMDREPLSGMKTGIVAGPSGVVS